MRMKTATTSAQNFLREQVAAVLIRVQALAGSAEQKQGRHGNRCRDAGADEFGRPHQSGVNKSSRVFEARSLLIVAATQHNLHAVNVLTTFAMRGP